MYRVLFPFAQERLHSYMSHADAGDLAKLADEYSAETDPERPSWDGTAVAGAESYLQWLMSKDRKSTALKSIQGKIWDEGFRSGELRGEVFPDVPEAMERWKADGRDINIFSSGSVLAQKLLFGFSNAGDLTRYLSGFFDTETGPKREAASYSAIASQIGVAPEQVLFLSDVAEELQAAEGAGMKACLVVRPGNKAAEFEPRVQTLLDGRLHTA